MSFYCENCEERGEDAERLVDILTAERDALSARLAEAEALLLEAREELNSWMYYGHGSRTSGFGSAPLCNRIEEVTHE